MTGSACVQDVTKTNTHRIFVGKAVGKTPNERPKRNRKNSIRMDLRKTDLVYWMWMKVAQDHVQWRVLALAMMNFWIPPSSVC
jgi:hypothetical protein